MGKNNQSKNGAPKPSSVPNREIYQRLNFLYQASTYLKTIEALSPPVDTASVRRVSLGDVASSYVRNMRAIGNKSVIRMDPNVKRSICKKCHTVLLPGQTVTIRIKGPKVVYGCISCGSARAIPAPSIGSTPSNNSMDVEEASVSAKPRKERQKFFKLPLFAQPDAGHVIFRGDDMVADSLQERFQ